MAFINVALFVLLGFATVASTAEALKSFLTTRILAQQTQTGFFGAAQQTASATYAMVLLGQPVAYSISLRKTSGTPLAVLHLIVIPYFLRLHV